MTRGFDDRLAAVDDALTDVTRDDANEDAWTPSTDTPDAAAADDVVDDSSDGTVSADPGERARAGGVEDEVSADVAALTDRVAELEAAVQALRGYAGSVRAVNDRVEERADVAVATVDDVRERVAALERDGVPATDTAPDAVGAGEARSGGCTCGEGGGFSVATRSRAERDSRAVAEPDGSGRSGGGSRSGGASRSGDVPGWPPADPGAPYGEVDADDDREQRGLVARLRDAL